MGYWGYEPDQNDATMDAVGEVADAVEALVRKAYGLPPPTRRGRRPWPPARLTAARLRRLVGPFERAGVVVWALERGFCVPAAAVGRAAADMLASAKDAKWVSSCQEPDEARRVFREVAASLRRLLRADALRLKRIRARRRTSRRFEPLILAPDGWRCRSSAQRARSARLVVRRWRRRRRGSVATK